jgi:hypothetical protein
MVPSFERAREFERLLSEKVQKQFPSYRPMWNEDLESYQVTVWKAGLHTSVWVTGLTVEDIREHLLPRLVDELVEQLEENIRRFERGEP